MKDWALALILKPLFMLLLFGGVCIPIRLYLKKSLPEGRVKYELLKNRSGPDATIKDKLIMGGSVFAIYGLLFAGFYFLS